ncbi:MAG: sulfite exporter TauE/SafE family protein [Candidatus Brocadiales bacterium]|nr:sulfite exporter TauE/SafE family protein [Candidatus Bathyanammoxibius sp.]
MDVVPEHIHIVGLKFAFEVAVGLIIGVFAGITGMPLGALRLPAIYSVVPTPQVAAGTNLGIDILTATTAAYRYWKANLVDITVLVYMGSFSCIGAFLGGYSSGFVSYKWLLLFIGIIYFCVGLDMLRSAAASGGSWTGQSGQSGKGQPGGERPGVGWGRGWKFRVEMTGRKGTVIAALFGFILGFVGGMVGLLMGSLRVPAMIKVMGLTPATAAGTNMVISTFFAISGFSGHLMHKNLDLSVLLTVGTASVVGSYAGSHLGITLSPSMARRLIGTAIILMATIIFMTGIRL